jgi:hypothetical protein
VDDQTTLQHDAPRRFADRPIVYFLIGIGAAVLGLLPWLITGLRLPLQNLWATEVLPDEMPIALLPFSQYSVTLIAGMVITGSLIAGLIVRFLHARRARSGVLAATLGVLLVQIIATVQSAAVTSSGLRMSSATGLYLLALVGGTVVAIALGLLVLLLVARGGKPGALIAFSFAAVAAEQWLDALILPVGTVVVSSFSSQLLSAAQWVPAILVGLAIAWCGVGTVGRAIAAFVSLLLLWLTPALVTAITSAAGTRVLTPYPSEMAEYAVQVFFLALGQPGWSPRLVMIAVVVALIGVAVRWMLRRRVAVA